MEKRILDLLERKPEKGLEKLMNMYTGLIYTIVYNKLNSFCSKEDIEECVSSVFFEAYEKRASIDLSKGTLKAFLAVLAKRRAIDTFRKYEKNIGVVISLDECEEKRSEKLIAGGITTTDDETKNMVIDSIKELGPPDSEIFIRKYYIGQDTKTIAKILNIKENTVDKKVSRGLVKLKKILIKQNTDVDEYKCDLKNERIMKGFFAKECAAPNKQERKDI